VPEASYKPFAETTQPITGLSSDMGTAMRRILRGISLMLLLPLLYTTAVLAQAPRRPLDHSVYDEWKAIEGQLISPDGRWVLYEVVPRDEGDGVLIARSTESDTEHRIPLGTSARFDHDSRYAIFLIEPSEEALREAQAEQRSREEQPRNQLGILRLADGQLTRKERVRSFRLPEDAGGWVAYLLEREPTPAEEEATAGAEPAAEAEEAQPAREESELGRTLMLLDLERGSEASFNYVTDYRPAPDGERLFLVIAEPDPARDGVYVTTADGDPPVPLLTGTGSYDGLALDDQGRQVAFLSDRDDQESDQPALSLYHWRVGRDEAVAVVGPGSEGLPAEWWISDNRNPSFSPNGRRIFFGTAPRPEPEPEETGDEEEDEESQVRLDIWHWQDPYLQPQQLLQVDQERRRTYQAMVRLTDGRVVQLADEAIPTVRLAAGGDTDIAYASTNVPYQKRGSWDTPGWSDIYLIDVATGERRLVMEEVQVNISISPQGRFLTWWDYGERTWFAMNLLSGAIVDLSGNIPYPVWNELHDTPSPTPAYGNAGFTEDDEFFLIYDRHDIWATDPSGSTSPRCITEQVGREQNLRFRYVRIDPEEEWVDPGARILLSAFDMTGKGSGFYRDRVRGSGLPEELVMMDYRLGNPVKAREADRLLLTRESYREFPDLWASDLRFRDMTKLSEANPQMSEYLWGSAEIVSWQAADGTTLEGILYKPEDFDPSRRYPMMVTFYERNSDNLHRHWAPEPHRSIINYTFYASRGYLVFLPDIPYRIGYPGESALNAVVPGVLNLVDRGFVDRENIGVAGHSWGGYQIAFMITRTNLFKAAEAGAPVSNMTSAYGGIRWASGMSRMFQYERTQSRIGATLWEAPLKYIENSPIFWADKIETPLLIMHNDEDGAVPWEQGIELFVALRRLGKPVWMITYNEQPHWPITWPNKKDWAVRLQQFFDHFLTGAPAPLWISEGVPAIDKGRTLGREIPPN